MTRLGADWVDAPPSAAVFEALGVAGARAWYVGGCVRDALLGRPGGDIDIATDALPEAVVTAVEAAGLRAVPTGLEHGTVTVISDGTPHEVTTLRRDVETDGRHAVVAFSDRLEDDAARRDLTMNALYALRDGTLIDPLGGLADLHARRVRFIGAPEDRIREDYLRILRFFRFYAWFGDPAEGLDPKGLAACAANADGIERLSKERIGAEMRKLLSAPDPAPALAAMAQAGVLARVLPGASSDPIAPLVHLEAGRTPDPLRRLAALGGIAPEAALRLSRQEARRLQTLSESAREGASPAELGYRLGAADAADTLLVRAALMGTSLPETALDQADFAAAQTLPVVAADLADRHWGPALGAALRAAEARWIASGFTLDKAALLRLDRETGAD